MIRYRVPEFGVIKRNSKGQNIYPLEEYQETLRRFDEYLNDVRQHVVGFSIDRITSFLQEMVDLTLPSGPYAQCLVQYEKDR